MGIPTIPFQVTPYMSLPLPLQVHNAHVHNGSQIGKGFHGHYVGALFIAVNIELKKKEQFQSQNAPDAPQRDIYHPKETQPYQVCPSCALLDASRREMLTKGHGQPTGDPLTSQGFLTWHPMDGFQRNSLEINVKCLHAFFCGEGSNSYILEGQSILDYNLFEGRS